MEPGLSDPTTVMYRAPSDITVLRNYAVSGQSNTPVFSELQIWAPSGAVANDREATLSLVRGDNNEEFMDVYNNGYSSETQYGIRIQKRSTGSYRDFVFDQYDGTNPKLPIMALASDRTVHMRSHGDSTNWTGTDSIHATASVTTTDATQTTLFALTLDDNRSYFITARVVGRRSDGMQRAFYWRAALAYRQGAGATMQGSVVNLATVESDSSWDSTIDASGNDARLRATGVAATTIYWVATIEYQSVSSSS
jgi:hypothetical protein